MVRRVEITARVVVAASPDQVWRTAVDWPRQRRWMPATRVHGDHGPGAKVFARTGVGPIGFTDTMVIKEWDPPRRCVMQHTGRLVRGVGVFEVAKAGDGCEFRWAEELQLPLGAAGGLGWRLIRPAAQRAMDLALRRFARLVYPEAVR